MISAHRIYKTIKTPNLTALVGGFFMPEFQGKAMFLSPHFTLHEMVQSGTAARQGINNTPNAEITASLKNLCVHVLEPIRAQFGPVIVTSGYRCEALNRAIGGAPRSQHKQGQAADIKIHGIEPIEVCRWIVRAQLPFDQLIQEGHWTHVSYCDSPRQQVLTARFSSSGVHYKKGLV